jgi:hypothetical protein
VLPWKCVFSKSCESERHQWMLAVADLPTWQFFCHWPCQTVHVPTLRVAAPLYPCFHLLVHVSKLLKEYHTANFTKNQTLNISLNCRDQCPCQVIQVFRSFPQANFSVYCCLLAIRLLASRTNLNYARDANRAVPLCFSLLSPCQVSLGFSYVQDNIGKTNCRSFASFHRLSIKLLSESS